MSLTWKASIQYVPLPGKAKAEAKPRPPSLGRRVLNVSKALGRAAISFCTGNPIRVSEASTIKRQTICAVCEWNVDDVCTHAKCGCPTRNRVLSKTEVFSESCPNGLWGPGEWKE